MTGTEIIALARSHYGEATANVVTTDMGVQFLNEAMREIYSDLPAKQLKELITTSSVALTSGKGDVVSTWDKVIEVYVSGNPATRVSKETIENSSISDYFAPGVPIFYIDESHLWVLPTSETASIVHLSPPSDIASGDLGDEITDIHSAYHEAIASLMASYMYAQEEDLTQAQHYKSEYASKLSNISERLAAEVSG